MNSGASSTVHEFSSSRSSKLLLSCKLVAVPQLTVGPTSRNLLWEHYQTGELLWLLQTQKQPRNQTPSNLPLCKTFLDLQNWYYWFPTIALDFFLSESIYLTRDLINTRSNIESDLKTTDTKNLKAFSINFNLCLPSLMCSGEWLFFKILFKMFFLTI